MFYKYVRVFLYFVVITVLLATLGFGQDALVFPDSMAVSFTKQVNFDTVTIEIVNYNSTEISHLYITDFTLSEVVLVKCMVDSVEQSNITPQINYGFPVPLKYNVSWYIGSFSQSVYLKYYALGNKGDDIQWFGEKAAPIFGVIDTAFSSCCIGLRGNIDNDGEDEININDVIYFINYIFGDPQGPAPVCFDETDINADGSINITDLLLIINYMFSAVGTIPPCQ